MTNNYYRNADAAILCYSLTDRNSLINLYQWYELANDVVKMRDEPFLWAIVGTKTDLSDIEVNQDEAKQLRAKIGTDLRFYVSSKTGENIDNALDKIIAAVHKRKTCPNSATHSFKLRKKELKKSSCC